ncbi:MAG TPA: hypothetical protein DEW35_04020 [Ruminococcaceae bacterium]|nr:hypothetical protein [Oscillospiraceae bacterium]
MTVLEDLWYGNLHPVEEFLTDNKEYKGLLRIGAKNREKLENSLFPEQTELFEKYYTATNEMNSVSETAAFQYGFSLGVRLMIESVSIQLTNED